ncbi:hypothetical protein HUJ04_006712 [Dendroctonus ponderosae]
MPSGARRISRPGRAGSHGDPGASRSAPIVPLLEPPSLPKHFPFPISSNSSDLIFDVILVLYAIVAAALQFLYLYRSVWWLPNSYTQSTMNFYLIDPNLVILIVVIFARRIYYQVGCLFISRVYSNKTEEELSCFSRYVLLIFYASMIGILATIVLGNRDKMDIVYLFYPITLYIPIFGLKIRPFFEVSTWCSNGVQPLHACSSNPSDIRIECEHLKANFLDRLRQIFFTAAVNSYYGSFIPCCFSQSELVYERYWNVEHGVLIFAGSFVFSFVHMIPLKYCDILHRAILHSGIWQKLENERSVVIVTHEWREDVLWPSGVIVKWNKSLWKSMGDCNCITPGDKALAWGYQLFSSPSYPLTLAATFQCALVFYQFYSVLYTVYWYRILALGIMTFFNYYSLYKLIRDSIVSHSMYKRREEPSGSKDAPPNLIGGAPSQSHNRAHKHVKNKTEEHGMLQDEPLFEYDAMDER